MGTISEAEANSTITLDGVEIMEKGDVREFSRFGRLGQVCTCRVKDETGEMDLTLWNEDVNKFEVGDKVKLTDGWCKEWNGRLQASTGKNGTLEKL